METATKNGLLAIIRKELERLHIKLERAKKRATFLEHQIADYSERAREISAERTKD